MAGELHKKLINCHSFVINRSHLLPVRDAAGPPAALNIPRKRRPKWL